MVGCLTEKVLRLRIFLVLRIEIEIGHRISRIISYAYIKKEYMI